MDPRPIAMLDSGVGGLSVLREVRRQFPHEDILYFADQGHVPYGPRPAAQIRQFVHEITRFFLYHDAKAVVIACNSASAVALHPIRAAYPDVPFVGMEPAVKPAALHTQSGTIGVIATKATYQGELFASVVDRFAQDVEVVTQVCPTFVTLVEAGHTTTREARRIAEGYLQPLIEAGIDQLVLGCTHFPFLIPLLRDILGQQVTIVDPSPAVARQAGRVIVHNTPSHQGTVRFYTSGNPDHFRTVAQRLIAEPVTDVTGVEWREDTLLAAER